MKRVKLIFPRIRLSSLLVVVRSLFSSTQSIIGLDIGTSYVKIAQLRRVKGGYVVVDYLLRALSPSAKQHQQEKLSFVKTVIKEFMEQTRIKTTLSRLAISGNKVYIFSFFLPPLSEKDLKGAINIELKKRLPFQIDVNSLYVSYIVADKSNQQKNQYQVSCIAVDRFFLNEHIGVLKEAGLRPVGVSVVPDALGNLINFLPEDYEYSVVLDMGTKESCLNFYKRGKLQFSRQISVGGEHFTKAVMRAISSFGEKEITLEDAEKVKRECGIPLEEEHSQEYLTDFGVTRGVELSAVFRSVLERLVNEILRTVNYYSRTFQVEKIDVFFLTGGSSRVKNIDKFFQENLLPALTLRINKLKRLDPLQTTKGWMEVKISKHELMMAEAAPHLASCFGLCLGKGGQLNFLPSKERWEQKIEYLFSIVRLVVPLLLAVLVGFYSYTYTQSLRYKRMIEETKKEVKRLAPLVEQVKEYQRLQRRLVVRKALLKKVVGQQPPWTEVLKELTLVTPQEIALEYLEVKNKKKGYEIRLKGIVVSQYTTVDLALSQYLVNLDESPYFQDVRLVSIEKDIYSSLPQANFEIVARLVY